MYIKIMLLLFLLIIFANIISAIKNYNQFHYYEIIAFNSFERNKLYNLQSKESSVIFLTEVSNDASIPIQVIVDPNYTNIFEQWLIDTGLEHKKLPWFMNVLHRSLSGQNTTLHDTYVNSATFHPLNEIYNGIDLLVKKHSSIISKIVIGKSIENREIIVVKISTGRRKQSILIKAGEQGREWLTTNIVMEIMELVIRNNKMMQSLLNDYDFHLLPILNPDGYDYAFNEDLFWAKNRRQLLLQAKCNENRSSVGVSVDRNWIINPGKKGTGKSCDSIYEAEPVALSAYINKIAANLMAFINLKGFGQIVMVPDIHKKHDITNFPVAMEILKIAMKAYRDKFGVKYKFSKTSRIMYNYTGGVADWVKYYHNIPLVYTFQLSKSRRYNFHSMSEVENVTTEFVFILNEILVLGRDIYSPLFNHCRHIGSNCLHFFTIFVANIILWFLQ